MKLSKLTLLTFLTLNVSAAFAFTVGTNLKYDYKPTYGQQLKSINIGNQNIQFFNSNTNQPMDLYSHNNEIYLAGNNGDPYYIKVCSSPYYNQRHPTPRNLNIISVDGLNVITGKPAGYNQPGYVLNNDGSCNTIKGWRKNLKEEAQFVLTDSSQSYANRISQNVNNVGVIGIASFKEKVYSPPPIPEIPTPLAGMPRYSNMEDGALPQKSAEVQDSARTMSSSEPMMKKESKLGTGHGDRVDSQAVRTEFEKASDNPYRVTKIYYDSYRNLEDKGIIRKGSKMPNPFPESGFAPDPKY